MNIEVNEIDFRALKQLNDKREDLKRIEKKTKAYHFSTPDVMFEHFKSMSERKEVEQQIFKLIKQL